MPIYIPALVILSSAYDATCGIRHLSNQDDRLWVLMEQVVKVYAIGDIIVINSRQDGRSTLQWFQGRLDLSDIDVSDVMQTAQRGLWEGIICKFAAQAAVDTCLSIPTLQYHMRCGFGLAINEAAVQTSTLKALESLPRSNIPISATISSL